MRKLASLAAVICVLLAGRTALTQSENPSGITISPAFQEVTISESAPSRTFEFKLTNHTGQTQQFQLSPADFGALDEGGGVAFIGLTDKNVEYQYGLAAWITLEKDSVVLKSGETASVRVTLNNRRSLGPGGHYGAILVRPHSETVSGQNEVGINQVASSLIFLKKDGGAHFGLELREEQLRRRLIGFPSTMHLRFMSTGNTHVVPRGLVTVYDPLTREVARGIINQESGLALPGNVRSLRVPIRKLGGWMFPGAYRVRIDYRYDGRQDVTTEWRTFYYLGWHNFILLVVLLGLARASLRPRGRRLLVALRANTRRRR